MEHRTSNTPPHITSIKKSPQLQVVFTLEGRVTHNIIADTEGEGVELDRRLKLIHPGLEVIRAIWKQGSTASTE